MQVPAHSLDSCRFIDDVRFEFLPETSRWVSREVPERTTTALFGPLAEA